MSRIAKSLPVSPKLYRHFAVATVVITVSLAMFADGSSREALEAEIAAQKMPKAPMNKDSVKVTADARHGLQRRGGSQSGGGFGPDPLPESDGGGGGGGYIITDRSGRPDPARLLRRRPPVRKLPDGRLVVGIGSGDPGAPGPWLEGASPGGEGGMSAPSMPSPQQIEAMTAASRARSGSAEE